MASGPGPVLNPGSAGSPRGPAQDTTPMDAILALTAIILLLTFVGLAAVELGADTRPGFGGSLGES
jgi:hypothetical protein